MSAAAQALPFIASISPLAITPGSPGFTLVVNGAYFSPDSIVRWNGTDHIPTSVTASRIEVEIAASEIAVAGTAVVTVSSRPPGGGVSSQTFVHVVTPAAKIGFRSSTADVGTQTTAVTAADLDGDQYPDIVSTNALTSSVSVLKGYGDGRFGARADFQTGSGPAAVQVADVNHDGRPDLLTANAWADTVSVLLGNGNGTFAAATDFVVASEPSALATGDLNADGFLDLVVADAGAGSVSVLLGTGDGTFTSRVDYATGAVPGAIIVGDFNADGKLDVMTADRGASSLSLLPGIGDGTLGARAVIDVGSRPLDLAAGDFNADGVPDLAVTYRFSGTVSLLLGNGIGTFDVKSDVAAAGRPRAILLGDVNADGHLDAVVSHSDSDLISVLLADSSGTFASQLDFVVGLTQVSIAVADFDRDGRLDVAVADQSADTVSVLIGSAIRTNRPPVLTNPGAQSAFQGVAFTLALAAEDADDDPLTWTVQGLPPGMALNPSTGVLSGVPSTIATSAVTITVSDGSESALASFAWSVASPLPGPATPLTPADSIATAMPAFSWSAVSAATYYALSITAGGIGSPALAWFTPAQAGCATGGGACTVASPRALVPGLVNWKVLTWNPYGYGPWSTNATVIVNVADPATPAPTPVGPSGLIATRTPTYGWQPLSATINWYQVSVTDALGTVRDFWSTPAVACDATFCSQSPNGVLPVGRAQWRVRGFSASGAGAWSATTTFEASESAPGKSTPLTPVFSVPTSTPAFTWNAVLGATYYLLRVSAGDRVIVDRWYRPADAGCQPGIGICAALLAPLAPGPFNWQVITWNGSGYGPWSDRRDFIIEVADPAAPTSATISPGGFIATQYPSYTWTTVPGATAYRVSIRTVAGTPTYSWYSPTTAGCVAAPTCSVTPQAGLENGTSAEWQVQAWTSRGFGPWTAPVTLTVRIAAPRPIPSADEQASTVRVIEYGWDRPSPEFVRAHIADMEGRPFDGVVMGLPDDGGDVFRPEAWDADKLASQLPILRDIQWQSFDSNFLAMYAASSMDWYDDADWSVVLQHAAFMARAAREGHLKGLMFDPEPYGRSPWTYAEQRHASERTFIEYEKVVRERGRAFMRALQQEYPGLDVLTLHGYSDFLRASVAPGIDGRETVLKSHVRGLLPAFLDGMLEEVDSGTQMIDGHEQSYFAERPEDFAKAAADVREGALPYVSSDLWTSYSSHVQGAQPLYVDWLFGYFKTSTPSLGDGVSDAQRAQLAEHHAYYAMKNADRYVWVYSEKMNWWTGEHLPPGAEDALRSAAKKFRSGELAP